MNSDGIIHHLGDFAVIAIVFDKETKAFLNYNNIGNTLSQRR